MADAEKPRPELAGGDVGKSVARELVVPVQVVFRERRPVRPEQRDAEAELCTPAAGLFVERSCAARVFAAEPAQRKALPRAVALAAERMPKPGERLVPALVAPLPGQAVEPDAAELPPQELDLSGPLVFQPEAPLDVPAAEAPQHLQPELEVPPAQEPVSAEQAVEQQAWLLQKAQPAARELRRPLSFA